MIHAVARISYRIEGEDCLSSIPQIASKIIGHFSIENHHLSGAILHYLCISNRKSLIKLAILLQLRARLAQLGVGVLVHCKIHHFKFQRFLVVNARFLVLNIKCIIFSSLQSHLIRSTPL